MAAYKDDRLSLMPMVRTMAPPWVSNSYWWGQSNVFCHVYSEAYKLVVLQCIGFFALPARYQKFVTAGARFDCHTLFVDGAQMVLMLTRVSKVRHVKLQACFKVHFNDPRVGGRVKAAHMPGRFHQHVSYAKGLLLKQHSAI